MNEHVSIKKAYPDTAIITVLIALGLIGLTLVYSAGIAKGNLSIFYKQSLFFAVGVIVASILTVLPPKFYYALAYVVYGVALAFLGAVLVLGIVGLGAKRWLDLGFLVVQPSEPAKLAFIIALSRLLADWRKKISWKLVSAVALLAMPAFIMVLMQPDLGTSTVFPVLCLAMLVWYGIPAQYFLMMIMPLLALITVVLPFLVVPTLLAGLLWLKRAGVNWLGLAAMILICLGGAVAGPKAWNHLEPYQQRRLTTFIDPAADPLGAGYQVIQSQVAIGSGGFAGLGFCQGTQTQLRFLPQQHTDFIFSLAGEEFGFLGTSFILLLYSILVWRGYQSANQIRNQFMGLVAAGMTTMLFYHSVINISMAMGNLPVTGLPLPFLSYGGTFLITCLAAGGALLSASLHRRTY